MGKHKRSNKKSKKDRKQERFEFYRQTTDQVAMDLASDSVKKKNRKRNSRIMIANVSSSTSNDTPDPCILGHPTGSPDLLLGQHLTPEQTEAKIDELKEVLQNLGTNDDRILTESSPVNQSLNDLNNNPDLEAASENEIDSKEYIITTTKGPINLNDIDVGEAFRYVGATKANLSKFNKRFVDMNCFQEASLFECRKFENQGKFLKNKITTVRNWLDDKRIKPVFPYEANQYIEIIDEIINDLLKIIEGRGLLADYVRNFRNPDDLPAAPQKVRPTGAIPKRPIIEPRIDVDTDPPSFPVVDHPSPPSDRTISTERLIERLQDELKLDYEAKLGEVNVLLDRNKASLENEINEIKTQFTALGSSLGDKTKKLEATLATNQNSVLGLLEKNRLELSTENKNNFERLRDLGRSFNDFKTDQEMQILQLDNKIIGLNTNMIDLSALFKSEFTNFKKELLGPRDYFSTPPPPVFPLPQQQASEARANVSQARGFRERPNPNNTPLFDPSVSATPNTREHQGHVRGRVHPEFQNRNENVGADDDLDDFDDLLDDLLDNGEDDDVPPPRRPPPPPPGGPPDPPGDPPPGDQPPGRPGPPGPPGPPPPDPPNPPNPPPGPPPPPPPRGNPPNGPPGPPGPPNDPPPPGPPPGPPGQPPQRPRGVFPLPPDPPPDPPDDPGDDPDDLDDDDYDPPPPPAAGNRRGNVRDIVFYRTQAKPNKLEPFDGDYKKYSYFKIAFRSNMRMERYPTERAKAVRLKEELRGPALHDIYHLVETLDENSYKEMWRILDENYGGREKIINIKNETMFRIPKLEKMSMDELRNFKNKLASYLLICENNPAARDSTFEMLNHCKAKFPRHELLSYKQWQIQTLRPDNIFVFKEWVDQRFLFEKHLIDITYTSELRDKLHKKTKATTFKQEDIDIDIDQQVPLSPCKSDSDSEESEHNSHDSNESNENSESEIKEPDYIFLSDEKGKKYKFVKPKSKKVNKKVETLAQDTSVRNKISTAIKSASQIPNCEFCFQGKHLLEKCFKFQKATIMDKSSFIKKNGICFRCLRKGHYASACLLDPSKNCEKDGCTRKHHPVLHGKLGNYYAEDLALFNEI